MKNKRCTTTATPDAVRIGFALRIGSSWGRLASGTAAIISINLGWFARRCSFAAAAHNLATFGFFFDPKFSTEITEVKEEGCNKQRKLFDYLKTEQSEKLPACMLLFLPLLCNKNMHEY